MARQDLLSCPKTSCSRRRLSHTHSRSLLTTVIGIQIIIITIILITIILIVIIIVIILISKEETLTRPLTVTPDHMLNSEEVLPRLLRMSSD